MFVNGNIQMKANFVFCDFFPFLSEWKASRMNMKQSFQSEIENMFGYLIFNETSIDQV